MKYLILLLSLITLPLYAGEYAKITRDLQDTGERKHFDSPPPTKEQLHGDKPYWVPVEKIDTNPSGKVRSGRSVEVREGKVIVTRQYRDKSQGEILSEKRNKALEAWKEDQLMQCSLPECIEYQDEAR